MMANAVIDRIKEIMENNPPQAKVTGIDFIYVYPEPNQMTLDVYFLHPSTTPALPKKLLGTLTKKDIRIYNPSGDVKDIPVIHLNWNAAGDVLQLILSQTGDFTLYKLDINDIRVDALYNDVTFDFKANCPSDLDCAPPPHECPPDAWVDFPIDYSARDFWSYRQALLDFAALRYPDWPDRLEADAGVMMAELMSAVGDEMAYYQDRIAREAYLQTATQRRSLRQHARLVDYDLHDGLGATGWIDVTANASGNLKAGADVYVAGQSGFKANFEIGRGLKEVFANKQYAVAAALNEFEPHLWGEPRMCLPIGATELYIKGHHKAILAFDDLPVGKNPGKWVMLQTNPLNPAQPIRTHTVRLIEITNMTDLLVIDLQTNLPMLITKIVWEQDQATPFEMDMTVLLVRGNILPITSGKTKEHYFITGADITDFGKGTPSEQAQQDALRHLPLRNSSTTSTISASRAVEREGRDNTVVYLSSLPESAQESLVWLGDIPVTIHPEIVLQKMMFDSVNSKWIIPLKPEEWTWKRSFVGSNSSQSEDAHFTLDDGTWQRVVGYQRIGEEIVHQDYAANAGVTIRFGDGEFGRVPEKMSVFKVTYRLGNGRRSNVASNTITHFEPNPLISFVESVTNPLPTEGGMDAETADEVRQLAPEAFRAVTYRAVRPEDYAEVVERLAWVQRAGATFRWTGSWLTAFATPDPRGAVVVSKDHEKDGARQLNRFRQAGREAYMKSPVYANMDLEIEICAEPTSYQSEVKSRVMITLFGKKGIFSTAGYFSADNFTFGTPLDRSTLEAAIQATPGVKAVESIRYRRRGWFEWQTFTAFSYSPGDNVIIRVENDPLHPDRGSLKLYIHGGA